MSLVQELDLDSPFEDMAHETVLSIVRTAGLLSQVGATLFRRFGLTEAQFNVLFALKYKKRDITQSELGKRMMVSRASVTSVLDNMEEKDLVKRNGVPKNRRIYHVSLTDRGRGLIDEVEPVYRARVHEAMMSLDQTACQAMIRALEGVRTGTRRVQEILKETVSAA